jgi:EAL domain-containing protein (putative c-di-GMP-specific phosphodiesterase class I)
MANGDENSEIVKTIVTLAINLGMSVVAEGVETVEQNNLLRDLNCEYGQGYFFSRPVDSATASELLLKANGSASASRPLMIYAGQHPLTTIVGNVPA